MRVRFSFPIKPIFSFKTGPVTALLQHQDLAVSCPRHRQRPCIPPSLRCRQNQCPSRRSGRPVPRCRFPSCEEGPFAVMASCVHLTRVIFGLSKVSFTLVPLLSWLRFITVFKGLVLLAFPLYGFRCYDRSIRTVDIKT